jgi:hypothetical protein
MHIDGLSRDQGAHVPKERPERFVCEGIAVAIDPEAWGTKAAAQEQRPIAPEIGLEVGTGEIGD